MSIDSASIVNYSADNTTNTTLPTIDNVDPLTSPTSNTRTNLQSILPTSVPFHVANENITMNSPTITTPTMDNPAITITDPKTNVKQIIIGLLPDGTYGIVVSKPGVDVLSVFA